MSSRLIESLENSPIIDRNGYKYFVHPLTDGVPRMEPEVLQEVIDWMLEVGNFDCDVILAPESMGIPLAVPLSLKLNIPYSIIRKRTYGLPGEHIIEQKTGYSKSCMTINGIRRGDRVVIVDDVVSTGGTLDALIKGLQNIGTEIVDILVPINKSDGTDIVLKETGFRVKTRVKVSVQGERLVCLTD